MSPLQAIWLMSLLIDQKIDNPDYQAVVVSQDGKMMTITTKGKNPDGEPFDNVQVYDRQ